MPSVPRRVLRNVSRRLTTALSALGMTQRAAHALHVAQTWIAPDCSPSDTPAEVVLDTAASTVQESYVDLTIHGFWSTDSLAPDGQTYQVLAFPGLGGFGQIGAPNLPVMNGKPGIAPDAVDATLTEVTESGAQDVAASSVPPDTKTSCSL